MKTSAMKVVSCVGLFLLYKDVSCLKFPNKQCSSTRLYSATVDKSLVPQHTFVTSARNKFNNLFKFGKTNKVVGIVLFAMVLFGSVSVAHAQGVQTTSTLETEASVASETDRNTPADSFELTSSGLKYRDLVVGEGASPKAGDKVRVHYTGWLGGFGGNDGSSSSVKFDSSYDRRSPLVFTVGVRQVIAGTVICL